MNLSKYSIPLTRPASLLFWCLWHFLAAAAIVLVSTLSSAKNGVVAIDLLGIGMATTYVVSAILLTLYTGVQAKITFARSLSLLLSPFSIFFLFLLLTHAEHPRFILLTTFAAALALGILPLTLKNSLQWPALFSLASVVILVPAIGLSRPSQPKFVVEKKIISSSLYNLVATYHLNYMTAEVTGGALSRFGDHYLLATGDGQLRLLSWDSEQSQLKSSNLVLRVPLNRDDFVRDAEKYQNVNTRVFRTADILVQDFGDNFRLFASHHYWNTENQCFTVRVSAIRGNYSQLLADEDLQGWETVFESTPCLRFKPRRDRFAGYQIGGTMALLDNYNLLLTMGDHKLDGVDSDEMISQDQTTDYGKTILINLDTNAASKYSIGHRNAQGIYVDGRGTIWSTEHGPKGGDELNIIREGKNYGWPIVTYGTDYTQPGWPFNPHQGRHDGFEPPVYAWIPSIAVSAVTGIRGDLFKSWEGDLLVSSLADRAIYRMRTEQERVIFTERIEIGWRIRSLIEDANGRLVLWTEALNDAPTQTAIIVIEAAGIDSDPNMAGLNAAQRGELLFSRCRGCHKVEDGTAHGIGPDLQGMFERSVAAAAGYSYSDALKRVSGRWTEENLSAFLADPRSFAPGTSMQFDGIADPAERASLIDYLKSRR